jgi:hypothetical protein
MSRKVTEERKEAWRRKRDESATAPPFDESSRKVQRQRDDQIN